MTKHEALFFPLVKRRTTYCGKGASKKSHYTDYHSEIEEDCKHRCVYCDISLEEHGYEGMVLDHFRPEKHFPKLRNDPNNLILSCPKCNRSKWHHWPCSKEDNMPSHLDKVGFIDPFTEDRKNYFSITIDGQLESTKPPAQYMLDMLNLNRKSRVQVRRRRIIQNELRLLIDACSDCINSVSVSVHNGELSAEHALNELGKLHSTNRRLQDILNEMLAW